MIDNFLYCVERPILISAVEIAKYRTAQHSTQGEER